MYIKHNIEQILISLDQFLNVLICSIIEPNRKQWADETFSSHCYRCRNNNRRWKCLYKFVNLLFFWQSKDHCKDAYFSEIERNHLPPEQRM